MEPNEERQGNDKKAERLAKRRERRRQRLLEETACTITRNNRNETTGTCPRRVHARGDC